MRTLLLILVAVLVVGVLLATQDENLANEVALALPFVDAVWTGPVLWMVGGFFGVGFALGYLAGLPGRLSASMRERKARKELSKTSDERTAAVAHLNEAEPRPRPRSATEADEMQRLADEVARRTETVKRDNPPPPPAV